MEHIIIKSLRYISLFVYIFAFHLQAQTPPSMQGMFVVHQMRDSVYNLKQAAMQIAQQSASSIIADTNKLNGMIKVVKDRTGITQAETQLKTTQDSLDQAMAVLYTKAFDRQKVSLYHKIYSVLQEIFNDSVIKEKSDMVLQLQQEMVQRIIANPNTINHWTKQIQDAGQKISYLAATQEKAVDPILTQAQSIKSQLAAAQTSSPQLAPLEQKLAKKNAELQLALNDLPTSVKIQIKQLQDTIGKSNFLLQYIQDPRKAAIASPENIIAKEMDPAFATTQ